MVRKAEEIRLSLWIEQRMRKQFGSKRRAKQEILARYASLIYMGSGQYGIARGADYYFGRSLDQFTADDADKAALLAGTAKSARYFAPDAVIRKIVRDSSEIVFVARGETPPVHVNDEAAFSLVQEGLRGVVRLPGGTAHTLGSRRFPIAVTGKTGTTNEFRDALFVGRKPAAGWRFRCSKN